MARFEILYFAFSDGAGTKVGNAQSPAEHTLSPKGFDHTTRSEHEGFAFAKKLDHKKGVCERKGLVQGLFFFADHIRVSF